jgi:hypothetical protein
MAKKADFTTEEWGTIRDAPLLVTLSVATAGSSGPIGSLKEAFAPVHAIVEASKGSNELLRNVCDRAELKEAQQSIHASVKVTDFKSLRESLQTLAADKASQAVATLKSKGAAGDLDAYRSFVIDLADRTANAAKEGSFLGFGGERVSEGERAVIARISQALGLQPA